jgi:hypothetical protein
MVVLTDLLMKLAANKLSVTSSNIKERDTVGLACPISSKNRYTCVPNMIDKII